MIDMNTPKPSITEPERIRLNGLIEAAIDTIDAETISENYDGQTEQTDSKMTLTTNISSHHSNERPHLVSSPLNVESNTDFPALGGSKQSYKACSSQVGIQSWH
jgi:hypothetical protein